MKVTNTPFEGLLLIEPGVYTDDRGFFYESYNRKTFLKTVGLDMEFVQDNQSFSVKNVIRGLHFQVSPQAQAKLVRVLHGNILDVVVDLRRAQATFGKVFSLELSVENKYQLLIPRGFAHGFSVLSETAEVLYKCDDYYGRESERGIRYDDPALSINWGVNHEEAIVSDKDRSLPLLSQLSLSILKW